MPKRANKSKRQPRNRRPRQRKRGGIRGQGAYSWKDGARLVAPAIGGALGFSGAGIPGAAAGITAGGLFNKIAGLGAYSGALSTGSQVPYMHSNATGIRVVHQEFITDVSSSVLFTLASYYVNPGIAATFPWLSNLAANFENYKFKGLAFYFKSTSADALNSTNTALGTVVTAADYNAGSPTPINKQQLEQAMWSTSAKPSQSFLAPIECDQKDNALGTMYIRNAAAGSPATGMDLRFTDLCRFDFATVGSQAAAVVGELWVTYDVILSKPILNYGAPSTTYTAHYLATTGISNSAPLGTLVKHYDNMQLTLTPTVISIPAQVCGQFLVSILWGTGATVGVGPTVTFNNCTGLAVFENGATSYAYTTSAVGVQHMLIAVTVPLSTTASTITLGGSGTVSTTTCDLTIAQLNTLMTN